MKKLKDRIREIAYGDAADFEMEQDTYLKMVKIAYYMGLEDSARSICDRHKAIYNEQYKRDSKCRYHHMAYNIIGNIDEIYDPNYAGDMTDSFGDDLTNL